MSQPVQDSLVGTLFDQRYLINFLVARGGMGNIYQAHDTKRGHIVAVKLLRSEYSGDPIILRRFLREANVVQSLKHQNICQLYDIGQTESGEYYFTMEYLEGHALDALLAEKHVLKPTEAIRYMIQVAAGLSEAHAKGIVHRDMKPANIFIAETPNTPDFVKILDFGVAKTPTGTVSDWDPKLTSAGSTVGTPYYMSPEQIRGLDTVDCRSDVYSLGIILWECVFGAPPFTGTGMIDVFQKALNDKLPRLAPQYKGHASYEKLYKVLLKALEKEPNRRIKSMADLIRELEKCLLNVKDESGVVLSSSFKGMETSHTAVNMPSLVGHMDKFASYVSRSSWMKFLLITLATLLLVGGVALGFVLLTPANVVVEEENYTTFKFFSDISSDVRVDGQKIASTPASIDLKTLPPFDVVFISASTGEKYSFTVKELTGGVQGYAVNLKPQPTDSPVMRINSMPKGAKVYINGTPTGEKTPCTIPIESPDDVKITIVMDGYISERIFTAHRGADIEINTNLQRQ